MRQREEDELMQAIAASLHEQELKEQEQKKLMEKYSAPAQRTASPAAGPSASTAQTSSLYNKVCPGASPSPLSSPRVSE